MQFKFANVKKLANKTEQVFYQLRVFPKHIALATNTLFKYRKFMCIYEKKSKHICGVRFHEKINELHYILLFEIE